MSPGILVVFFCDSSACFCPTLKTKNTKIKKDIIERLSLNKRTRKCIDIEVNLEGASCHPKIL